MFEDLIRLIFGTDPGESGDGGLFDIIQSLFGIGDGGELSSGDIGTLLSLLGGFGLSNSSFGQPQIPQVGYQGGIPDYTGVRQRAPLATGIEYTDETGRPYVAPTGSGLGALAGEVMPQGGGPASPYTPTGRVLPLGYDPNRRPGSGGRRYFTDMQYVPTGGDMGENVAPDQAALAQARARADQQGLALLLGNLSNLARERRSGDPTNIMPTQAGPMPTDNYVPPQPEPEPEPAPAPEPEPPGGPGGPAPAPEPEPGPGDPPPPGGGGPVKDPVFPHGGDDNTLGDDVIGTPLDDDGDPLGTGTGGPADDPLGTGTGGPADDPLGTGTGGPADEPDLSDDDGYTGPEPEPEIADRDGYTGPEPEPEPQPAPEPEPEPEPQPAPEPEPSGNGIRDAAPPYWMVAGERFENRNAAIARARALGDPGGLELFAADGTLISGRPQYTAEEREEQRRLAEERRAAWEARQERNRQRNAYWSGLIDEYGADEYQQTVNQDDYYTIDSPRLGQLKFASFQDAKSFLEKFNTGGDESITDVYDRSQGGGMPQSFGSIKSSGGDKTMYVFGNTADRYGEVFEDRNKAADYLMDDVMQKGRDRFLREVNFKAQGGGYYKPGEPLYRDLSDFDLSTEEGYNKLKRRVGADKANYLSKMVDPEHMRSQVMDRLENYEDNSYVGALAPGLRMRQFAEGGIANLSKGRYLNGSTDGMADQIPATIDGKQPAALSDGEFVIPADVVSHLGNGNSDAGAKVLEQMMARTRKKRTGNSKQGKQINPRNVLPS